MLSFHESLSYGATLQCVALQRIIRQLGYEPEFIDFQRRKCTDANNSKQTVNFKERTKDNLIKMAISVQGLLSKRNDINVSRAFEKFKSEHLVVGKHEFSSMKELYLYQNDYSTLVTGSDQVWNPFSKYLRAYGLGFAGTNVNTVAYAASIGVSEIPEDRREYVREYVKNVKYISCREYEGAAALSKLLGRDIPAVLDPTLLLNKETWVSYASSQEKKERYVLCFFLGSLEYPRKIARKIARENRCKLYIIPGSPKDLLSPGDIVKGCGPKEFLNVFLNADFICTDSFHGTAFCVNLNKPFYSFCRRGYDEKTSYISRIRDLLETVHLQDRLVFPDSAVGFRIEDIDFTAANNALDEERKKSMKFLTNALRDGEQK